MELPLHVLPHLYSRGSAVEMAAVGDCLDINTPLGRIKVVHYTLKVLQAVAAYAPHAPDVPIALGNIITERTSSGRFRSSVAFFPGALDLTKCSEQGAGSNGCTWKPPTLLDFAQIMVIIAWWKVKADAQQADAITSIRHSWCIY